jgi:enoyl-CoA hydratase/carnithine racemase
MSSVTFVEEGNVGRIVLTNPPFNFVSDEYNADLSAAVHNAGQSDIRALLISAEGPNFSIGGAVHEWSDKSYRWFRTFIAEVTRSYRGIEALEVPVVAAVRGQAGGGGLELALAADFIVASENAVFWCIENLAAQLPMAGGFQRLLSLVGPTTARRMVMLGEPTSVAEIPDAVERIVPDAELDQAALDLAVQLAHGPTRAYAAAKAVQKAWYSGGVASADELLLELTIDLYNTEDFQAAFRAAAEITGPLLRGDRPPKGLDELTITYTGR